MVNPKAWFEQLSPQARQRLIVGGALGGIIGVAFILVPLLEPRQIERVKVEPPEVSVVGPVRQTGIEQFAERMNLLEKRLGELTEQLARLQAQGGQRQQVQRPAPEAAPPTPPAEERATDDTEMAPLESVEPLPMATPARPPAAPPRLPQTPPAAPSVPQVAPAVPEEVAPERPEEQPTEATTTPPVGGEIQILGEEGALDDEKVKQLGQPKTTERAPKGVYLPSGSMFTAVLINGLDAPTTAAAQRNPTPVVLRVKRDAILPNYASIEIRECFALAAGYGQLSSERAIMRTETLSCVRWDGNVIETKIDGYLVGTDGKVGIPGRLVSKQGQMIARALLAGIFSGLSEALDVDQVDSLNLVSKDDNKILYQQEDLQAVLQSGAIGGFQSAANMVAKFYLDMAKETFPVVEVAAGEVATIMITRGTTLPLRGSTRLQLVKAPNQQRERTPVPTGPAPETTAVENPTAPTTPTAGETWSTAPLPEQGALVERALQQARQRREQTQASW